MVEQHISILAVHFRYLPLHLGESLDTDISGGIQPMGKGHQRHAEFIYMESRSTKLSINGNQEDLLDANCALHIEDSYD